MKDISELFFNIYSVFLFSSFFRGLAFLGRINTRVHTKLLPQYHTVQKCAIPTKPIFCRLEQVKGKFFLGGGGLQAPWMVSTTVNKIYTKTTSDETQKNYP